MPTGIPNRVIAAKYEQLIVDLRLAREIGHPGESGRAREGIIRRFIRTLTPANFGVDTGFVFDAAGNMSRQVDVVVYRTDYHPHFEIGGVKHFMIESVVAVFEVKARIEQRDLLDQALENVASVKGLDMTGGGTNYLVVPGMPPVADYGQPFEIEPYGGIVCESIMQERTTAEHLMGWMTDHPRSEWPNMLTAVSSYTVRYLTDTGHSTEDPHIASTLAVSRFDDDATPPLFDFAIGLANRLRISHVVDFSPSNYFGHNVNIHGTIALDDAEFPGRLDLPRLPDSAYSGENQAKEP